MTANTPSNLSDAERSVCIGAGALIALAGLRRSTTGLALAAIGCALALRGWSGYCPLYQRLGITRRPTKAEVEKCIDVTVDDSFPASDPPAWVGGRN